MSVGRKKGAGGKLARSEVITVRLDPRLRFGAELAAWKQRRTLSSFVEWAVEEALKRVDVGESTIRDVLEAVWDVDDADRLAKLGLYFPQLLTHEEERLWKLIRENGFLWLGRWIAKGDRQEWIWDTREDSLVWDRLREHWQTLKLVASGESPKTALPTWPKEKKSEPPPPPANPSPSNSARSNPVSTVHPTRGTWQPAPAIAPKVPEDDMPAPVFPDDDDIPF